MLKATNVPAEGVECSGRKPHSGPAFLVWIVMAVAIMVLTPHAAELTADGQTFDGYFEAYDGETWLLIGRGREGWEFDTDGQGNVDDVALNLKTPAGFAPACYSDAMINDLLSQAGTGLNSLTVRVMRASTTNGTGEYQEYRLSAFSGFPNSNADFTSDWDAGSGDGSRLATIQRVNAPAALNGASAGTSTGAGLRDYNPSNNGNRMFTWGWGGHVNKQGFSYGQTVTEGFNDPDSFLWESGTEGHAIPYAEVYIPYQRPPSVSTSNTAATNVTATTADLQGTLDGTGSVFEVYAYWSTSNNAGPAEWLADTSASNAFVAAYTNVVGQSLSNPVASLESGTVYYYTFMATNAATNIWATPNAVFKTAELLDWSNPTTSNITDRTSWATATVNTNLHTCVLVWAETDQGTGSTNDWPVLNRLSLGSQRAGPVTGQMTWLNSSTSYVWRLYGENTTTNGWSEATPFTTADPPPSRIYWSPADTATAAWYDAADAATVLTNGAGVTDWLDKGGNDRHVLQTNGSLQPANGRTIGGRNAIDFDNGRALQTAALATWLNGTKYHVIAVLQHDAAGYFVGTDGPEGGGQVLHLGQRNSTEWRLAHFGNDAGFSHDLDTTPLLAVNSFNNTGSDVFIDGTSLGTSGNPGVALNTSGVLSIGRPVGIYAPGDLGYFNGGIGEIVVIVGDLSTAERQRFEGYLAHKWGFDEHLPPDHPYRFAIPGAPVQFGGLTASNITATSADLYANARTNLTLATVVWDTVDRGTASRSDWAGSSSVTGATPGVVMGTASNLLPDTAYVFRFYGEDGSTNGWSEAFSFATDIAAANNPVFTSVTSTHNAVSLTWTDNANTETGYVLQRSTNGTSYAELTLLPANTTHYTDQAVAVPRAYTYRLAVTNSLNGSGTDPSACETSAPPTALSGDMIFYENFEEPVIDGEVDTQPPSWVKEPQPADGGDGPVRQLAGLSDGAVAGKTGDQFASLQRYNYGLTTKTNAGLTNALQAGVNYTLTCDLSRSHDANYMYVELRAGTNVLMVKTIQSAAVGDLSAQPVSMTFLALADHPHIGEIIGVRIFTDYNAYHAGRWYFDNLALYATETATDTDPPTPSTMAWVDLPTSSVSNSITMMATNAVDVNGVEYFFTNTVNGNVSGWQESRIWRDTGLTPGVTYSYRAMARDRSANLNETAWSSEESAKSEPYIILYESFETPSLREKGSDSAFGDATWALPPAGWYGSSDNYQRLCLEGASTFPTETPFGEQFAASRAGYIETTDTHALSGHALKKFYTYRVTCHTGGAGERAGEEDGVPCASVVQLFAGSNVVATATNAVTLDDFSETVELEFVPEARHPQLRAPLQIRLSKSGGNWWYFSIFDNIKVYAIPPPPQGPVLIVR